MLMFYQYVYWHLCQAKLWTLDLCIASLIYKRWVCDRACYRVRQPRWPASLLTVHLVSDMTLHSHTELHPVLLPLTMHVCTQSVSQLTCLWTFPTSSASYHSFCPSICFLHNPHTQTQTHVSLPHLFSSFFFLNKFLPNCLSAFNIIFYLYNRFKDGFQGKAKIMCKHL